MVLEQNMIKRYPLDLKPEGQKKHNERPQSQLLPMLHNVRTMCSSSGENVTFLLVV